MSLQHESDDAGMAFDHSNEMMIASSTITPQPKSYQIEDVKEIPAVICDTTDLEGIALLRQIFPDLTDDELNKLHSERLGYRNHSANSSTLEQHPAYKQQPTSSLGKRLWRERLAEIQKTKDTGDDTPPISWRQVELPDGFLQLPPSVAVRRFNEKNEQWYYLLVKRLEEQVLEQILAHDDFSGLPGQALSNWGCYSRVIHRDVKIGLGMSLCEDRGRVLVHSLLGLDGQRWFVAPSNSKCDGPAMMAGIVPGHWLLGINGEALIPMMSYHKALLHNAVSLIQYSPDPVVLHLREIKVDRNHPLVSSNANQQDDPCRRPSLLDMTALSLLEKDAKELIHEVASPLQKIHPFVSELDDRGLMHGIEDQLRCTKQLASYTERTRQWESFSSFCLNARTYSLCSHFDHRDLPVRGCGEHFALENVLVESVRPYAPSTPTLDPSTDYIPPAFLNSGDELSVLTEDDEPYFLEPISFLSDGRPVGLKEARPHGKSWRSFPGSERQSELRRENGNGSDIFIPLMGVRKALCVRIVNSFVDGVRTAYTIWVFDVESGCEWYAPVRYQADFQDLRLVALPLCPSLAQLPFPQAAWKVFAREKAETEEIREVKCKQLEYFLRKLCSMLYTDPLHPVISEIAIHLQSFLGCDSANTNLEIQTHTTHNDAMFRHMPGASHSEAQMTVRLLLKRSIQRYVYRLFLLEQLQNVVNDFVDATREQAPKLRDIEFIESQGRNKLKQRAMEDLERIQAFLDQLQNIIMEGCRSDFKSICQRRDYSVLRPFVEGSSDDTYMGRVFREAVREQIEIEVYVPLRGVISRLLVNGWRHDDMEIHFKMNELRRRPQSRMRIPPDKESPSGWSSVSSILSEGVGMSTLPCVKLRAIVDSATEISRLHAAEKRMTEEVTQELGADDFLPIFIYCVVQAQMERPSALCVLLRTLCEPANRIGEIGYYLASFEAALAHIQEISLSEN